LQYFVDCIPVTDLSLVNPDVDLEDGWRGDGQALGYSLSQGFGGARPSRVNDFESQRLR
jgi:hypothetical protein